MSSASQAPVRGKAASRLALVAILAAAAALRLVGLGWGLRHPPHMDERVFVENVFAMEAAEAVDARLCGAPAPGRAKAEPLRKGAVKPDFYPARPSVTLPRQPADHWRTDPDAELQGTITEAEFLHEISRCFSCGLCFGCEQCFMFCNATGFTRLTQAKPGAYFAVHLGRCQACGKCADLCPCGFLTPH